ncbi:MAG: class I SAM-dependent methyltransferase [Planctomycetes bacterium]|nr:class I SAM-dependent methyltransferase [Planctomycetota bacterium]MCB9871874.1 class I SAM-dependent methyltransferase [Planctomycetota bacterium]MCB9888824.1 class I SAM-dependent methyltransferase [Planctomycetota bacterium]
MELSVYEQFAQLEEGHFWFKGRRTIFFDLIERSLTPLASGTERQILEVGCGAGGMLGPLSRFGKVTGIDISREYVQYCHQRGHNRVVTGSGYELPFRDASFDLVALFDVIEHIPDDERVMQEVRRVLKPGGQVFISVPAYQFLFSQNDRVAHHLRRYTARRLHQVLSQAKLQPAKLTYFNTFLFPLILPAVLVLKAKERLFGLPEGLTNLSHQFREPVNGIFAWVMGAERWLLRHIEFPFGHSLIAMAR